MWFVWLPEELLRAIFQYLSVDSLLRMRAVHPRFTSVATKEVSVSCELVKGVRSLVTVLMADDNRKLKRPGMYFGRCWFPQVREVSIWFDRAEDCLPVVKFVAGLELSPCVHLSFGQAVPMNLVKPIMEEFKGLPPGYTINLHLTAVRNWNLYGPMVIDDPKITMVRLISDNYSATGLPEIVTASPNSNCLLDLGMEFGQPDIGFFSSLLKTYSTFYTRDLTLSGMTFDFRRMKEDWSETEEKIRCDRISFFSCRSPFSSPPLRIEFTATHVTVDLTSLKVIKSFAFPNAVCLTINSDTPTTSFADLIDTDAFSSIKSLQLRDITCSAADLGEFLYRIQGQLNRLEIIDISIRISTGNALTEVSTVLNALIPIACQQYLQHQHVNVYSYDSHCLIFSFQGSKLQQLI
ncbi:hypothetical protein TRICI_006659 [Trichomonascus ciferrii]|uniref:F-box domain-containing protein n=1 Tax=Trichomonascus ciferrii TaxID=44093 RepID=A0A642UEX5_9ASCO|nr:hypothetical protein TRICI_006659 [Trichomonascus ciferrii]